MSDKDNNLLKSDILTVGSELSEKLNAIGVPNTFGKASEGKDNLMSIIRMTINGLDMTIDQIREILRDYYNKSEVNTLLNGKSDTSHNHDSAYANISHNHDSAYASKSHQHDGTDVILNNSNDVNSEITTIEDDITSLNGNVNSLSTSITNLTATETITINPSNVSGANPIYFTLIGGKFVKVSWIDNEVTVSSSSVGSYKVLGTLPEKYRPHSQVWFTQAFSLQVDRGRQTSLAIMPNGQVQLYCWWTGTNQATPCVFTDIYSLF